MERRDKACLSVAAARHGQKSLAVLPKRDLPPFPGCTLALPLVGGAQSRERKPADRVALPLAGGVGRAAIFCGRTRTTPASNTAHSLVRLPLPLGEGRGEGSRDGVEKTQKRLDTVPFAVTI